MLQLLAGIGDRVSIIMPLAGLTELASAYEQSETAATLVGAVDARVAETGDFELNRFVRFAGDNRDRAAKRACAFLGEERCAKLRAAGQAMPLEEAVALAAMVRVAEELRFPSPPAGPLTPRERDVLSLVATGLTDREIAEALFLSPRTVNTHVARILAKLDVPTRRAAAAWARKHGKLPHDVSDSLRRRGSRRKYASPTDVRGDSPSACSYTATVMTPGAVEVARTGQSEPALPHLTLVVTLRGKVALAETRRTRR